jgi:hypothetical protein
LIVNWQRRKGQNISRKVVLNSSRRQKAGKNIIVAVDIVVVEQKREGLFTSYYSRYNVTRDQRLDGI